MLPGERFVYEPNPDGKKNAGDEVDIILRGVSRRTRGWRVLLSVEVLGVAVVARLGVEAQRIAATIDVRPAMQPRETIIDCSVRSS